VILDVLENRGRYRGASLGIERALEYLGDTDFSGLKDGKYPIESDEIYAMLASYNTEPESERRFEAHRKYFDVQYILAGREVIYWSPTDELTPAGEYSKERDIVFLSGNARARLQLTTGSFAVFYPEDAHKPNCAWDGPEPVRKVVIKVRID
jgi:YhcH/YjgK/YiaL family protein